MYFKRVGNKNMQIGYSGWYNVLRSYDKIIAILHKKQVYINSEYYDYSRTTSRHLNLFLGVDAKQFKENCKNGEYIFLTDREIQEMYYGIE